MSSPREGFGFCLMYFHVIQHIVLVNNLQDYTKFINIRRNFITLKLYLKGIKCCLPTFSHFSFGLLGLYFIDRARELSNIDVF